MNEPVHILVVDDDPDTLAATVRLLERAGHVVAQASSGEKALQAIQEHRPDLVLLDYDLPGIDGPDVCRQIKTNAALAEIIVVITSASRIESDEQMDGFESGADGYIVRPLPNRELLARVEAYVRIIRLTRTLRRQAEELRNSNETISQANQASLSLMEDAVAARDRAEKALQALAESNQYLDNLFNYANAPIIVWDPRFRITRFNHAFETLTGRKAAEVLGASLEILFPPARVAASMELIRQTLGGERWETVEILIRHVDGSDRVVLWNSATVFAADGKTPVAAIAQGQEITDRKRAEAEIQKNELRLKMLVGILRHPAGTVQEFLDHALEQAIQLTGSRIGYIYHYHEDTRKIVLNAWSKEVMAECAVANPSTCYELDKTGIWGEAIRQRRPIIVNDFKAAHPLKKGYPKGHVELLKFMTIPIFRNGRITGVVGLANKATDYDDTDILQASLLMDAAWEVVDRKQAEDELQRRQSYLTAIIENQPGLVWLKDVEGRFLAVNQVFAASCGRQSAEEVAGRTDVDVWPAELAGKYRHDDQMVMEKGTAIITEELIRSQDDTRWFETYKTAVFSLQGKIIGTTGYAHDITERRRAEAELLQHRDHLEELVAQRTAELAEARDQAQAANRAKSAFLANMSHELRTPLTAVLGFSEVIARDPAIPGRIRDNLAIIIRSGEHLLALINDILDLSKIEAGRIEIERHDTDLGELVRDVINMMRGRAEAKGLNLLLNQSSDFPRFVNTDAGKLRQVLVNLVGNAIKFTHAGQVAVRLTATATADGHLLTAEIQDTGIGIARDDLDRIFRPFEQIGSRMTEGTGLGLAITRQFVQMLGGRISVDSEPGKGSCFRFTIPVGRVDPASAQALPVLRHPLRIGSPTADLRILIVEDQPENRLLLRCFLEPLDLQIRDAVNGEEAIAIFQEWRPRLIFMDRRMPVLDGLEATRRIKALPGGAETIVIAVSAHSFKEEQREMLAAGCTDFIAKPFGSDDLLNLLKKQLHLELVYGDAEESKSPGPRPLSADDLRGLPAAELATLHRLAIVCDELELVKWLETQDCLAPAAKEALAQLIKDYQFEEIQKITDSLMR